MRGDLPLISILYRMGLGLLQVIVKKSLSAELETPQTGSGQSRISPFSRQNGRVSYGIPGTVVSDDLPCIPRQGGMSDGVHDGLNDYITHTVPQCVRSTPSLLRCNQARMSALRHPYRIAVRNGHSIRHGPANIKTAQVGVDLVGFANLRTFPYQGKNPFLKFLS